MFKEKLNTLLVHATYLLCWCCFIVLLPVFTAAILLNRLRRPGKKR